MTRYRTLVLDPPWRYDSAATKADARKHYPTLTLAEIAALPVPDLAAKDAHLWLWTTNGFMGEAHDLLKGWEFSPLTIVTWCKRQPGVGHYLRNNTEHCILSSRGIPQVPETKPLSTWYVWPRAKHSQKPEAFYDLVEQVSPSPRLELFARRNRIGWSAWGNECISDVEVSA